VEGKEADPILVGEDLGVRLEDGDCLWQIGCPEYLLELTDCALKLWGYDWRWSFACGYCAFGAHFVIVIVRMTTICSFYDIMVLTF